MEEIHGGEVSMAFHGRRKVGRELNASGACVYRKSRGGIIHSSCLEPKGVVASSTYSKCGTLAWYRQLVIPEALNIFALHAIDCFIAIYGQIKPVSKILRRYSIPQLLGTLRGCCIIHPFQMWNAGMVLTVGHSQST